MRDATDSHNDDQQIGWVLIPPAILAAQDLSMGEKVLWGRVNGLTSKRGYCFATNEWLGDQLGYSTRTIEAYIASLVEKGYMKREYGAAGKRDRRLFPIPTRVGKSPAEDPHPYPSREDIPAPVGKTSLPESGSIESITVVSDIGVSSTPTPLGGSELKSEETPAIFSKGENYSAAFEEVWGIYHEATKRGSKFEAAKAFNATIRERMNGNAPDVSVGILLKCVRNYVEDMRLRGKLGTEYVMHCSTFLGPGARWREYQEWTPSSVTASQRGAGTGQLARGRTADEYAHVVKKVGE